MAGDCYSYERAYVVVAEFRKSVALGPRTLVPNMLIV